MGYFRSGQKEKIITILRKVQVLLLSWYSPASEFFCTGHGEMPSHLSTWPVEH